MHVHVRHDYVAAARALSHVASCPCAIQMMVYAIHCVNIKKVSTKRSGPKLAWKEMPAHDKVATKILPAVHEWMMAPDLFPTKNADVLAVRAPADNE